MVTEQIKHLFFRQLQIGINCNKNQGLQTNEGRFLPFPGVDHLSNMSGRKPTKRVWACEEASQALQASLPLYYQK